MRRVAFGTADVKAWGGKWKLTQEGVKSGSLTGLHSVGGEVSGHAQFNSYLVIVPNGFSEKIDKAWRAWLEISLVKNM